MNRSLHVSEFVLTATRSEKLISNTVVHINEVCEISVTEATLEHPHNVSIITPKSGDTKSMLFKFEPSDIHKNTVSVKILVRHSPCYLPEN